MESRIVAGGSPMDERDAQDDLRDLQRRLDKARDELSPGGARGVGRGGGTGSGNALAFGLRIGLELVVAIVVAVGIGWAFDKWLGTRPWGMVLMFFLGVAAGMLNVYRAVTGMGMAVGYKRQDGAETKDTVAWSDDED